MKKSLLLICLALGLATGLFAERFLAVIPVGEIRAKLSAPDLNRSLRSLAANGYEVYHYDANNVIAATPASGALDFPHEARLAKLPCGEDLYLVSKAGGTGRTGLLTAGKILWEMDSEYLFASPLPDQELRARIPQQYVRLSLEPLRFSNASQQLAWTEETRSAIMDLLSGVSADSVLVRLQGLQDLQTRYALADNRLQVAQWIRQQFINSGVADAQLQSFAWNNTTQYNVVATIPGTLYPNEYVIVGGHHDSRSNNSDSNFYAPGADDNASGTTAALEMARVIMQSGFQPKCSIRFVTFAAEEFGLWGSKYYAQNALENGQNIRLMINHDMIANQTGSENWQARLMPYDGSYGFSDFAVQVAEQFTGLDVFYGSLNSAQSDSHPFWQRGYKVLYFFESEFSPNYHSTQDVVANLNPVYCSEVIRASLACAAAFADQPSVPLAPENVRIISNAGSVTLSWDAVSQTNLGISCTPDYYAVYAADTPGGEYALAGTTTDLSYSYVLAPSSPDRRFFRVTAVRNSRR